MSTMDKKEKRKKLLKRLRKKDQKPQNWEGEIAVVMASGPSLAWDDYADVEAVKEYGFKTVVVNNTFEVVPYADVIYAGDGMWWKANHRKINSKAERWTCSKSVVGLYGANYRGRFIKPGFNSGANAVELTANVFKASAIIMLGFDMSVKHGVHHHGYHDKTSNPTKERAARWRPQFKSLRDRCIDTPIVNCSRYTEVPYFKKMKLAKGVEFCRSQLG